MTLFTSADNGLFHEPAESVPLRHAWTTERQFCYVSAQMKWILACLMASLKSLLFMSLVYDGPDIEMNGEFGVSASVKTWIGQKRSMPLPPEVWYISVLTSVPTPTILSFQIGSGDIHSKFLLKRDSDKGENQCMCLWLFVLKWKGYNIGESFVGIRASSWVNNHRRISCATLYGRYC